MSSARLISSSRDAVLKHKKTMVVLSAFLVGLKIRFAPLVRLLKSVSKRERCMSAYANSSSRCVLHDKGTQTFSRAMERRTALSNENADHSSRKNNFEVRRLRLKLDQLQKNQARQEKKLTNEQVEYAMENLSMDDRKSFTALTKKIIRSSFLPPVIKPKVPGGSLVMEDPYAERLRGTKFMQNSTRRKKLHTLSEKRLLRSSSDSSLVRNASAERQQVQDKRRKTSMNYGSLFLRKQLRLTLSDSEVSGRGRLAVRLKDAVRLATNTGDNQSSRNGKEKNTSRTEGTRFPVLMRHGVLTGQASFEDGEEKQSEGQRNDNGNQETLCLSEVIERKLRFREQARQSRHAEKARPLSAEQYPGLIRAKKETQKE